MDKIIEVGDRRYTEAEVDTLPPADKQVIKGALRLAEHVEAAKHYMNWFVDQTGPEVALQTVAAHTQVWGEANVLLQELDTLDQQIAALEPRFGKAAKAQWLLKRRLLRNVLLAKLLRDTFVAETNYLEVSK